MGNIPYCICFEKRKQITIKSDLDMNNIENMLNIGSSVKGADNHHFENGKMECENNKTTLSPQTRFNNPLPEMVIIKYKKL